LILGGNIDRELRALAHRADSTENMQNSVAIVSSGCCWTVEEYRLKLIEFYVDYTSVFDSVEAEAKADAAVTGLHVDRTACDTLTNFTTLFPFLEANHISRVLLCTGNEHIPRALFIGKIVLEWSAGFRIQATVPLRCCRGAEQESWFRVFRDAIRALIWAGTGFDGANITKIIHPLRL
jgi:hypothetical protein